MCEEIKNCKLLKSVLTNGSTLEGEIAEIAYLHKIKAQMTIVHPLIFIAPKPLANCVHDLTPTKATKCCKDTGYKRTEIFQSDKDLLHS